MRFAQPIFLYAFLFVPVLAWIFLLLAKFRQTMAARFVDKSLAENVGWRFDAKRYFWKNVLLCLAFTAAVGAMARPQWGFEWSKVKRQGVDIFLAIDTSKSMLTEDVKPNRLERSKLSARDLLKKLKGDRIGLIAFAGDAFLMCPLTVDYSGFLLSLDDLSAEAIPRGGTDIGRAIEEAMKGYEEVPAQYKAIIIVTDGENWEGDTMRWARAAAAKKIRIYTVGIGTREGELVRVVNDQGQAEFVKDKDGNFIKSRLNEKLLNEIAAATGGAYVRASGAESGLDYLYDNELTKLERRDIESEVEKKYHERYQWFVAIALILLLLETLIPTRREAV